LLDLVQLFPLDTFQTADKVETFIDSQIGEEHIFLIALANEFAMRF